MYELDFYNEGYDYDDYDLDFYDEDYEDYDFEDDYDEYDALEESLLLEAARKIEISNKKDSLKAKYAKYKAARIAKRKSVDSFEEWCAKRKRLKKAAIASASALAVAGGAYAAHRTGAVGKVKAGIHGKIERHQIKKLAGKDKGTHRNLERYYDAAESGNEKKAARLYRNLQIRNDIAKAGGKYHFWNGLGIKNRALAEEVIVAMNETLDEFGIYNEDARADFGETFLCGVYEGYDEY